MIKDFSPVRGTLEYNPAEMIIREKTQQIILDSYRKNGFSLIKTPILENLEFLMGSEGGENLRLMFKTIKRGSKLNLTKPNLAEQDLTEEGLRYDLTVPLIRFYCNNREKLPVPFKAIQIGDAFRAERPQRGRSREFTQCDIDIIGDSSINAEIELIFTAIQTYKKMGFDKVTIKVNDRRILNQLIKWSGFKEEDIEFILICLDKLDKIGLDGIKNNLTNRNFPEKSISKLLNSISLIQSDGVSALSSCGVDLIYTENINTLLSAVNNNLPKNFSVLFDISIIRGQGYYTGTVFEAYTDGFSRAIGGGGRYDKIMQKLSGVSSPMVGFSIGFEPCCMLIQERGIKLDNTKTLALIYSTEDNFGDVVKRKNELMKDYNVSLYTKPKNIKNLLNKLKDSGYTNFVFFNKNVTQENIGSLN